MVFVKQAYFGAAGGVGRFTWQGGAVIDCFQRAGGLLVEAAQDLTERSD
jgi:hypothetical protein